MPRALRIFVVDDNPQDRRLIMRELKRAYPDSVINEAIDQAQFESKVVQGDFDVVVTDYHLQWSDGIRVLQAVKQRLPSCPVIMFTATGSEEIAVEAMKLGLDDYIIKNVNHLVRLRGAVHAAIDHATTRERVDQLASRLESLLAQLDVGVFSCSPSGQILELNQAMVQLLTDLGRDPTSASIGALFADGQSEGAFLRNVMSSTEPQDVELVVQTPKKKPRVYRLSVRHTNTDLDGPRIDGLVEDITHRKQAAAKRRQAAVAAAQIAMLSTREADVLDHVAKGLANKVIARRLSISEKTVEKHRSSLMKKLNLRHVADLVRLVMLAEAGTG